MVKLLKKDVMYELVVNSEESLILPYQIMLYSNTKENIFFTINLN